MQGYNYTEPNRFVKLFPCILLCLLVGWIGGFISHTSITTWYPALIKPSWTPPNWVFPIVWTILYIMMGVSLWLVWISDTQNKLLAYILFGIQLGLNFLWSWIFFYQQHPLFALVDILLLWVAIGGTYLAFRKHSGLAAFLLIPYLLWVTYAISLNFFIWLYN